MIIKDIFKRVLGIKTRLEEIVGKEQIANIPKTDGFLYVANDLHSNFEDYITIVKKTKVFERILSGENIYFLINGDIIDHYPGHGKEGGDIKILDHLIEKKEELNKKGLGERLILLMGNHEYETVNYIYPNVKKDPDGKLNHNALIDACISTERGSSAGWDFANRINYKYYSFIINEFKTIAQSDNGIVICHASAPKTYDYFRKLDKDTIIENMLWERNAEHKYFLRKTGNRILITGHTPVHWVKDYVPGAVYDPVRRLSYVKDSWIIISPSYRQPKGKSGSYLRIQLDKKYLSQRDFKTNREVFLVRPDP